MKRKFRLLSINFIVFILFFSVFLIIYEIIFSQKQNLNILKVDQELGWNTSHEIELIGNLDYKREVTFIGDSFTQDAKWTHETIKQLNSKNYMTSGYSEGVSGYGTIQSLIKLKKKIKNHKPKFIVLLFYAWNDLRDNVDTPGIYYSPLMQKRPYYLNDKTYSIIKPDLNDHWVKNLTLYKNLFFKIISSVQDKIIEYFGVNYYAENKISKNLNYSQKVSWEPFYQEHMVNSAYVNLAWKKTKLALKDLKNTTNQSGAELIIIGIDNAFTVDNDVYDLWAKDIDNFNPNLPLEILEKECRDLAINFYNAIPDLQDLKEKTKNKIFEGPPGNLSGHLQPQGEKLIGEIVAKIIKSKL